MAINMIGNKDYDLFLDVYRQAHSFEVLSLNTPLYSSSPACEAMKDKTSHCHTLGKIYND